MEVMNAMTKRGQLLSLLNFDNKVYVLEQMEKESRAAANLALQNFDEEAYSEARRRERLAHEMKISMCSARLDMDTDYKRARLSRAALRRRSGRRKL